MASAVVSFLDEREPRVVEKAVAIHKSGTKLEPKALVVECENGISHSWPRKLVRDAQLYDENFTEQMLVDMPGREPEREYHPEERHEKHLRFLED
jgi:hypothetical protein